jgi:hypothetical protein
MAKHKYQSDRVHKGVGIDGGKGEDILDRNYDPWNPKVLSDGLSDGKGKYTDNKNVLNHKNGDPTRTNPWGEAKDLYDDVVKNSLDDDAGGSRPGPIKYGVD